ncbi:hypothetical protein C922_02561 [Plasmodium inui San Antonio 1]|uniref:Uncharacterized protein n=1 Tax=Plasmodium inui San Antonio 1 TaxID=1237626 RepID=W7A188_9APIC|nr:hypothetical protein C922_02561 [Plasmodium inui San Antonio 1]EUD66977.1 hypothetical protein C922_02561 [Plasmodium inui San Antonio 1]
MEEKGLPITVCREGGGEENTSNVGKWDMTTTFHSVDFPHHTHWHAKHRGECTTIRYTCGLSHRGSFQKRKVDNLGMFPGSFSGKEGGKEKQGGKKADKEKADKEKADKEQADKEKADKEQADKEKADKEQADKEQADKAEADKEEADKAEADTTNWRKKRNAAVKPLGGLFQSRRGRQHKRKRKRAQNHTCTLMYSCTSVWG